ncbi:dTDP-4-dehydrorhamnose reductase [Candidatus Roizmanbacteria bacterium RIFCSPLOWO2_02_FULL_37_19]|uniref:dTDP-4-dehydrorhamnose reductase n=1 Tax=Candidatus Roizmanbacteria bacterium RIFCSPHIGHO2_02_FULL_37_24 TaxID=1802037 RepID=A0A1F7GWJ5_9BACT|nr:MAG: dTDP-4-dehydrorhamnose reductase [Candidatus Roizmanbacteria bacterium RIFCSPHIGHO2_01_FULL_38_41]OGK23185.1 MAG: dTDP-4-dehydrorhamnose reductase [Candidatus Roizmanbacteria bacterium RIFCSPHIGHO2_02_FULL_37_24]OGK33829.1 MAG: dTDP-4-dehydrorhamnose reductase [Candidatus Roizmanbacteria bacterium RIFCSPHIGHO2_12_FULL_37_23]OGK43890.1 MAG: dTDP-4-dehydrorhamnose reductase [Candidatus Roizmanbacteria bacterium RIFCSPLOWO2_01_FULL_37_57]OGK53673.1 MAG: dTDP-4-dehydrorhamnose reductase [Ca
MRILITGAGGMLGSSLLKRIKKEKWEIYATGRKKGRGIIPLDITDFPSVKKTLSKIKPEVIIHLAALTNVDFAELHPDIAYRINTEAAKHLAEISRKIKSLLVFISTGAVFPGNKRKPYIESDIVSPVNIYGKSKLLAEQAVRKVDKYLIVRTGWLIGGKKKDKKFVAQIMDIISKEPKVLHVVSDVVGSPTLTDDLADAIVTLIKKGATGIYHVANEGTGSRKDIAKVVLEIMEKKHIKLKPVKLGFFNEAAPRPKMEAINSSLVNKKHGIQLPHWRKSLKKYILELHGEK